MIFVSSLRENRVGHGADQKLIFGMRMKKGIDGPDDSSVGWGLCNGILDIDDHVMRFVSRQGVDGL